MPIKPIISRFQALTIREAAEACGPDAVARDELARFCAAAVGFHVAWARQLRTDVLEDGRIKNAGAAGRSFLEAADALLDALGAAVPLAPDALAEPVADLKTCRDKFASWWPLSRTKDLARWRAQARRAEDQTA